MVITTTKQNVRVFFITPHKNYTMFRVWSESGEENLKRKSVQENVQCKRCPRIAIAITNAVRGITLVSSTKFLDSSSLAEHAK